MKILHVITDLKDGGAEAVLYRLISHDNSNQHYVVCLGDGGKYSSLLKKSNAQVLIVDIKSGIRGIARFYKLRATLKHFKPDLIQGWMYHGNIAATILKFLGLPIPIFWGIHHTNLVVGVDPLSTRLISRCLAVLSCKVPKSVSKIICCGDKSKIIHQSYGYAEKKLTVIQNGYDISHFKVNPVARKSVRDELGLDNDTFLIGCVGRYAPQKDHRNLITALEILKEKSQNFHLILVGHGCDVDNLELVSLILKSGLSEFVTLLGQRADVMSVMNALDIHVTSSAFGEAFPNVICEAMACGTVCVTTDVGDAAVIVGDTGIVVPPSDSVALSDALYRMNDDWITKIENWGVKGDDARRKIASNFSIELMVERYNYCWKQ